MKHLESEVYTLENFEGPLEFLWHLVCKNEIDIYSISLYKLIEQYLQKIRETLCNLDGGAEFLSITANLLFLKSKLLLPKHDQEITPEEEIDPKFEVIHQLIDYCHFKQTAKELSKRELEQSAFYFRGVDSVDIPKDLGIAHLSLDDLATLFQQVLAKASSNKGTIYEEIWKVSDKIRAIRESLQLQIQIPFNFLFSAECSREELIVTFLAILELMKGGEIVVTQDLMISRNTL